MATMTMDQLIRVFRSGSLEKSKIEHIVGVVNTKGVLKDIQQFEPVKGTEIAMISFEITHVMGIPQTGLAQVTQKKVGGSFPVVISAVTGNRRGGNVKSIIVISRDIGKLVLTPP